MIETDTPDQIIQRWNIRELYHFTAGRNIFSIRKHGGLFALSEHSELGIACDEFLSSPESRRRDAEKGLDKYIRLSFVKDYSMLTDALDRCANRRVLRLMIAPDVLNTTGARFSSEFAFQNGASTYPVNEMEARLDLNVVFGNGKRTKDDPIWTIGKARRSEILIPRHVSSMYIVDYEWLK